MPAKLRDPDQVAAYCAETALRGRMDVAAGLPMELHGTIITVPVERKFGQLDHVQTYVDWVLRQPAVKTAYPRAASVPVRVRRRAHGKMAHYESHSREGGPAIAIHNPKLGQVGWAMREVVVLHEVAHHLAVQDKRAHGHGLGFRQAFLFLLEEFIGAEASWMMKIEFYEQGLTA